MGEVRPSDFGVLELDDLVRRVVSSGSGLHWLTGAGASLSAGVPTAGDMIYDFKRALYAQAKRIDVVELDAGDPDVRIRLDSFFRRQEGVPLPGDPSEYAYFFERVHSDARGRQRKIEQILTDADPKPNLGHVILAVMWQLQLVHVVWTTNFDDVLEQAASLVSGAPRWLRRIDRSEPELVSAVYDVPGKPTLVKMHGDFQSQRLDNTIEELAADNELRRALSESMRTKGLIVTGYSGRDSSVMSALSAALDAERPFPSGLYWVARNSEDLLPEVPALLQAAKERSVDAHLVLCASFEELMSSVRYLLPLSEQQRALFDRFQPPARASTFDIPARGGRWPRLRLNAIAVSDFPTTCRLVKCTIGGTRDVRAAVAESDVRVLAARRRDGVIAFGRDEDLLTAFDETDPKLDYATLDVHHSADLGLIYDALVAALERTRPLTRVGRRTLVVTASTASDSRLDPLRRAGLKALAGLLPGGRGAWAEGIELRLEPRHGALWLVYTPTVWAERSDDSTENDRRREWTRERQVKRYNRPYTALLKAWADVLCSSGKEAALSSLGLQHGADAQFTIKRLAPYSERSR